MKGRFLTTLLVLIFSVKSFGFSFDFDDHHKSGDLAHNYFHIVGQPHHHGAQAHSESSHNGLLQGDYPNGHESHVSTSDELSGLASTVISYSDEALEHCNASFDGASNFIVYFVLDVCDEILPDHPIISRSPSRNSPFIEFNPPPPKA